MKETRPSADNPNPPAPASGEFVSGRETRLRQWFARLGAWLFSPPYLPVWAVWALLLVIGINGAFIVMQQPAEYWISHQHTMWNHLLLPASPFLFAGAWLLYALLLGLALSVTNRAVATVAWVLLAFSHLESIATSSWCGLQPLFVFDNASRCRTFQSGAIAIEALGWGLILAGFVAVITADPAQPPRRSGAGKALAGTAIASFLLLGAGIARMATLPRPTWHQVETAHTPSPLGWASAAFDPVRKVAILFGGSNSWNSDGWIGEGDTWQWDGSDWTQLTPAHSPPARFEASMAYDEQEGVILLFGGRDQQQFFGDTWEWDGTDWRQLTPRASPPARGLAGAFYDPSRKHVVVYGGYNGSDYLDDTWEWDRGTWQKIGLGTTHASDLNALAYDSSSRAPMIMDGTGLWLWKPEGLTELNLDIQPPARWDSQMASDPGRDYTVLFGGSIDKKILDDTWLYDGHAWKKVVTSKSPPPRGGFVLFYDSARGCFIVFGGNNDMVRLNDTWELVLP